MERKIKERAGDCQGREGSRERKKYITKKTKIEEKRKGRKTGENKGREAKRMKEKEQKMDEKRKGRKTGLPNHCHNNTIAPPSTPVPSRPPPG